MTKRNCSFLIGVIGCLIFGCYSLLAGQDVNWKLRNYHLYNAYAFVYDGIGFDYAPAGIQTYLNPLLDLPYFYLSRIPSPAQYGFIFGMLQGLNFWIIYEISRLFIPWRFQVPNAMGLMIVDQYAWKLNEPSGRKSSVGDFQPKDLRGLAL